MPFAADDFSGSSGALLHVYNSGWVRYSSSNGNGIVTPAGRVRGSAAGILLYYHSSDPASADYSVSADIFRASAETSARTCVTARQATGSMTCYAAGFDGDGGIWLSRLVSGSETQLAKVTHSFPQGETRRIRLECIGTAIKVYVDGSGTPAISVTDATITAAGKAGLRLGFFGSAVPSDSTCMHMDNWEAADPTGPAAELQAAAAAQVAAGGDLRTGIRLSGDALAQAVSASALTAGITLSAEAVTQAATSGMLDTIIRLIANASAETAAGGDLAAAGPGLASIVQARADATGILDTSIALTVSVHAQASAAGSLTTHIRLTAGALAEAIATGNLLLPMDMAGTAAAQAMAAGELDTWIRLSGDAWVQTAAAGVLDAAIRLRAEAGAQASTSAQLQEPTMLTVNPKFVSKARAKFASHARARRYTASLAIH